MHLITGLNADFYYQSVPSYRLLSKMTALSLDAISG